MKRFEIYKDEKGEFRWRYITKNGENWFISSEGYTRRRDAVRSAVDASSELAKGDHEYRIIK